MDWLKLLRGKSDPTQVARPSSEAVEGILLNLWDLDATIERALAQEL